MFAKIVCLLLIVPAAVFASPFSSCGAGIPQPSKISLANCTATQCTVIRKIPAAIELTFNAAVASTDVTAKVRAQVNGSWYPFPVGAQGNVCKNLTTGKCPLEFGDLAAYTLSIRIPGIAPADTLATVEVRLTNEKKKVVSCTHIAVLVQ